MTAAQLAAYRAGKSLAAASAAELTASLTALLEQQGAGSGDEPNMQVLRHVVCG